MPGTPAPRLPLPARTAEGRLVVVARAQQAADYDAVIDALIAAGVPSIELTLTTPGTLERLPELREKYGEAIDLGIGTVTNRDQLDRAVSGGAQYLVTPVTDPEIIRASVDAGVPIVPGGLTPSELFTSWRLGASAVKIFPAGVVGSAYVKDLRGPFPGLQVVPSGGVDLDSARGWLDAGALAVSVGGPLLGDAFRGGDLGALRERAAAFVRLCGQGD